MENVTFTYQRKKEDVLKQQVWQTYKRNKLIMLLTLFFPVLGVGFFISSLISDADPIVYFAVAYLILYPFVNYLFIRMRINKLFNNPDVAMDTTEFTYSTEGINLKSVQGELLVEWNRITKAYNMEDYIYLYVDKRSSIMVKKEILSTMQVEFILKLIKESTAETVCNY